MKTLVCVFAHPDDESFGPGGTIALWSKKYEITVICATAGEAGQHGPYSKREIGNIRKKELQRSAKILGVKKVIFLGFKDGALCNANYHKLVEKAKEYIDKIKPDTLLTFEPRGVSGHIDHVTMSMVTSFIFERTNYIKSLYYYCLSEAKRDKFAGKYFIYVPPGYNNSEIDLTVDIKPVWKIKTKAMYTHNSQKHDADRVLSLTADLPKEEHFLVLKK
ncbi:hypothetical protein A2690_02260 [Candidatus Roizmanbacteria bacterium RIFCSPHIGHO2_01_FULL_39_12b]|uniref:PIG-L family deacetylase n=1 Tax=Candidatus Roizmanbacteria bacterium RIFCSPHIGHO2_01_FULL_39_12b TaxID=1802030 RepID=A0A1F7GED9_9BACT|nr:MAG: hypothetical protein A2690_02260 [Candidatus Roizmanbacteria bacterium RIFCSPHIGHO2_01_FULL_39_12b]